MVTSNLFFTEVFLARQIRFFEADYDVTVIVNAAEPDYRAAIGGNADVLDFSLERKIRPWRDLVTLTRLFLHFARRRYDIVHSTTPKAGLLGMIAARFARVPVRIHTFTGQVWQTRTGPMRWLLKATDRLTARAATAVLIDGHHQLAFLHQHGVVAPPKARVLGQGSICGVDVVRFRPDEAARIEVRRQPGLPPTAVLLVYMARLTVDKGALVMAKAFAALAAAGAHEFHLLMIGPDEDRLTVQIEAVAGRHRPALHLMGYTREPEKYIAAADVFCLPSYREGFPMVLLNAAACAVPAVASRIHGSTDAIIDAVTGLFHEPGDETALVDRVLTLAADPALRRRLGEAARQRVVDLFSEEAATRELGALYRNLRDAVQRDAERRP